MLIGSILGFGIALALTPLLSRLVSPEVFGAFSAVVAVSAVFVGMSTMRLEIAAQRASESDARQLLGLALVLVATWSVTIEAVAAVAVAVFAAESLWLWVGPLVFLASLQLVGSAALTRRGLYRRLGTSNFVQGAGTGLAQLGAAAIQPTVGALVVGFALSRLVWFGGIPLRGVKRSRMRAVWSSHRRYALVSGSSAGVNSLASQLPVLLCSALYGSVAVGLLAMAVRLVLSPLGVVSQAVASAAIGEVAASLRTESGEAPRLVATGQRGLFLTGLGPSLVAGLLGTWVVPALLGGQWAQAGIMVALLSAGGLAQFTVSPFSQVLNLSGHSELLLRWDLTRLVLLLAAFVGPWAVRLDVVWAVGTYSAVMVVLYADLARRIRRALTVGGAPSGV